MRHYFIDLENVRSAGLDGVLSLTEDDRVFVFYSDNANTLTIPTMESISNSKARVKYIKINCYGSNAMDFQIVAMFGAMIEREKTGSFYIISHDNGFKSAVSFCKAFFEDLDINLGWYPKIRDTLKKEGLSEEEPAAETKVGITGKPLESGTAKKKSRRSRKPSGKAESEAQTPAAEQNAASEPDEQKSSRSRRRRRKSSEKTAQNAVETSAQEAAVETDRQEEKKQAGKTATMLSTDEPKSEDVPVKERYYYIYKALNGLLSEKTTDIYASSIHEALLKSKSKKDLKDFFDARYSGREGEALYTIVQSDFDNLRKQAKKNK